MRLTLARETTSQRSGALPPGSFTPTRYHAEKSAVVIKPADLGGLRVRNPDHTVFGYGHADYMTKGVVRTSFEDADSKLFDELGSPASDRGASATVTRVS